jgi:hypothetical protein
MNKMNKSQEKNGEGEGNIVTLFLRYSGFVDNASIR